MTITVPLWLALGVGVLALWALLDRLLMPSARWFVRSRADKVLDEVGRRLKIGIRPFQQVRRQALIDRLIFDDKVQQATQAFADARGMPREVALDQALPELWLRDEAQWPAARRLLHELQHPPERRWACRSCGEVIDGPFDSCWQCGAPMPTLEHGNDP